jgi:hypothetical protein
MAGSLVGPSPHQCPSAPAGRAESGTRLKRYHGRPFLPSPQRFPLFYYASASTKTHGGRCALL